jgi:hypothetical protein
MVADERFFHCDRCHTSHVSNQTDFFRRTRVTMLDLKLGD